MNYCFNPACSQPVNPTEAKFCQTCGSKLLLTDRYCAVKLTDKGGFGRTFLAEDWQKPSGSRCVDDVMNDRPGDRGVSGVSRRGVGFAANFSNRLG